MPLRELRADEPFEPFEPFEPRKMRELRPDEPFEPLTSTTAPAEALVTAPEVGPTFLGVPLEVYAHSAPPFGFPTLPGPREKGPLQRARESLVARGIPLEGAPPEVRRRMSLAAGHDDPTDIGRIALEGFYGRPIATRIDPETGIELYVNDSGKEVPINVPGFLNLKDLAADLRGLSPEVFIAAADWAAATVGGLGTGLITGGSGALPMSIVFGAAGAGLGHYFNLKEGQKYGYNTEKDDTELAAMSFKDAAVPSTIGALAFSLVGRLIFGNIPKEDLVPGAIGRAMMEAAERQGLPSPLFAQTIQNPVLRIALGFARQFSPRIQAKITAQERELLNVLIRDGGGTPRSAVDDATLLRLKEAAEQELADRLRNFRRVDRPTAYQLLRAGFKKWDVLARNEISRFYDDAFALGRDAVHSLEGTKAVLNDIDRGVLTHRDPADSLLSDKGKFVKAEKAPTEDNARLAEVKKRIRASDSNVRLVTEGGKTDLALRQLQAIRRDLFDLRNSPDSAVRDASRKLWHSIKNSMENPIQGSPEYVAAVKKANDANRAHEDMLEKSWISEALNKKIDPATFAAKYLQPNDIDAKLAWMKLHLPAKEFQGFRDGYITELITLAASPVEDGGQLLLNRLAQMRFHPVALRTLLTEEEEIVLRTYAEDLSKHLNSYEYKLLKTDLETGERLLASYKAGAKGEELAAMRDAIFRDGGKEGRIATGMRAALFKEIYEKVMADSAENVAPVANPAAVSAAVRAARRDPSLTLFMREKDWTFLNDVRNYGIGIMGRDTEGVGIAKGAAASALLNPLKFLQTRVHIFTAEMFATLFSLDAPRAIFQPAARVWHQQLRSVGGALTAAKESVNERQRQEEMAAFNASLRQ